MSIWTSLFTGASGLNAYDQAIGIVGDNIANVSTDGYRASRAGFSDILGGTAINGQRVGNGVEMMGPETMLTQGQLQTTGRSLDLAVNGTGVFMVQGDHQGLQGTYYTRDGRFASDKDGYIVTSEGLRLQGYEIDAAGALSTQPSDIKLNSEGPAQATNALNLSVNLDPASPAVTFNPSNPQATSSYSTSITVYDSLGASHRVDVYFAAQGNGAWQWHALVDGAQLTGGTAGTPTEIATGTMTFNTSGALLNQSMSSSSANFSGALPNQAIQFAFGDALSSGGTGFAGSTQLAGAFDVKSTSQNGYASGTLSDVQVAQDGTISGLYSNGQSRPLGRVALATFNAEGALTRAGDQLYVQSVDSGDPSVAAASSGSRGSIEAGSLEGSNVDLSQELVTMIAYQRAFEANSRTVTTADQMLTDLTQLAR